MAEYTSLKFTDLDFYFFYYDISGKHQLSIVVGEIDYDGTFMRMFKDELNPVPEYPEELTFEGAKNLKKR